MKEVAQQEVGEQMMRRVLTYRELLAKPPSTTSRCASTRRCSSG